LGGGGGGASTVALAGGGGGGAGGGGGGGGVPVPTFASVSTWQPVAATPEAPIATMANSGSITLWILMNASF
jgi:hypothetical protein